MKDVRFVRSAAPARGDFASQGLPRCRRRHTQSSSVRVHRWKACRTDPPALAANARESCRGSTPADPGEVWGCSPIELPDVMLAAAGAKRNGILPC